MRERYFRFKQFGVHHQISAMKVGIDAVLLGAWTNLDNCKSIIDVGCGCGIIALMLAQRTSDNIFITGIDIDNLSIEEANKNSIESKWSNRLNFLNVDFLTLSDIKFDHIVSNPPFFDDGITEITSTRIQARHAVSNGLSPYTLVKKGEELLTENGRISLICPISWQSILSQVTNEFNLKISRLTYVKGHSDAPVKRILVELSKNVENYIENTLALEHSRGIPTDEYIKLTSEFYLKF